MLLNQTRVVLDNTNTFLFIDAMDLTCFLKTYLLLKTATPQPFLLMLFKYFAPNQMPKKVFYEELNIILDQYHFVTNLRGSSSS